MTALFWHRRDLRIDDNKGLFDALKLQKDLYYHQYVNHVYAKKEQSFFLILRALLAVIFYEVIFGFPKFDT